ncbi:MAG: hypothetical protein K2X86_00950 [Cytophagaceae bacterium]|nr:hypothetical protein [Cytophagaceae bacterium]
MNFFHPFFILLFLVPLSSPASFDFNTKLEKAYSEFLKLKISGGQKLADEAIRENPDNGIAIYMSNYAEIISIFISEDKALYEKLKKNEDLRVKKISQLSKSSPYYLFTQAEIRLQWAFVKLKFGDEVSSVLNVRQAYKLLEQNMKAYPDFLPNKKTMGLLNILIGSVPDKYVSLLNLAGMNGDVNQGLQQLEEVANSTSPFKLEARIYKIMAENYILRNQEKDFNEIKNLYDTHTDNLLVSFLYASVLLKNAQSDDALKILNAKPAGPEYYAFPYLDYITAEIYLFKASYKQSRDAYNKFLSVYKGKNFIKDTYYKILLTYWLSNDEANARLYFDKILNSGQTVYDADKHAQKFAENKELPDKILMKSRLYFDGGFYQQALETINTFSINTSNNKNLIEYYYRKARIFHQMDNYSNAILFYLKTIELSKNTNYYFAPNSALQMGYIYKDQNNKELAKIYFNKALSYQNYEYKNTIDNKAKAALNELKQANR